MDSEQIGAQVNLEGIAELEFTKGEYRKALQYYQEALQIETSKEKDRELSHIASLHSKLALIYHRLGMFSEAITNCDTYLKSNKRTSSNKTKDQDEEETTFYGYQLLGRIYRDKGEYTKSAACYEKLSFIHNNSECRTERAAILKNEIGLLSQMQGGFNTALKYHKEALDIFTEKGIIDSLDVADAYEGFAWVNIRLEEYKLAYKYLQMALEIRTKLQGNNHIEVANLYDIFSEYYIQQSEYPKAHESCKKSLEIKQQKDCGLLDLARSYATLAKIYKEESEFNEAFKYYNMTIDLYKKQENHYPLLAEIYNSISFIQNRQNDSAGCLENCEKAEEIILKKLGPTHHFLGSTYLFKGIAYKNLGNFVESLIYFNKSLQIRINSFGEEHLLVASVYNNLGIFYYVKNRLPEALQCFNKFLDIGIKKVGEHHNSLTPVYNNIAVIYKVQGNYEESIKFHLKALEIRRKVFPKYNLNVGTSLYNIGNLYRAQGDHRMALSSFKEALDHYTNIWGKYHVDIIQATYFLAKTFKDVGRYQEAFSLLRKCILLCRKDLDNNNGRLVSYLNELEDMSQQMSQYKVEQECTF